MRHTKAIFNAQPPWWVCGMVTMMPRMMNKVAFRARVVARYRGLDRVPRSCSQPLSNGEITLAPPLNMLKKLVILVFQWFLVWS
jgi:hypothetical protein